ncbi:MFS transporter [Tabrizicola fusiformis]|uniref:MFS transporter n=1 Tax=Tabrizicola sp. SY72 TaxID=2741673 RepID=UPI001573A987|nr:MFS transporter [Tabrizicola sp. SY72]NTT85105.1 MFS transporter [Tabrizicola sp. SY72]
MKAGLTIVALWLAGLGAAAQFGKISVAYPSLGAAYAGYEGVWLGLMVSVVGMVGLIFGTTAGLLVARIGPRRAILAALVLGAAVSLVQSVFPPYPVMMLTRVLEGVSHLAIVVVGPTAIAATAPPARQGAAMTLWSSFFGLTYAVLFWLGPKLIEAAGAGALFQAHALWMLGCAALLATLMPTDRRATAQPGQGGLLAQHVAIYASPLTAAPAMGFVCYTVTYVAVLTLLPGLASPGWGGFIGVAMPLVSIAVSLTLGVWLLGRMPAVRLVQAGFALAVLGALGLWLAWGQGAAEAGFALVVAAALGIVQGASFASIPQLNPRPEDRAGAAGAIAQLGNLGTTTGTPLLAFLVEQAGASGLALFVLGFSGLGIAIHALQARRRASA